MRSKSDATDGRPGDAVVRVNPELAEALAFNVERRKAKGEKTTRAGLLDEYALAAARKERVKLVRELANEEGT